MVIPVVAKEEVGTGRRREEAQKKLVVSGTAPNMAARETGASHVRGQWTLVSLRNRHYFHVYEILSYPAWYCIVHEACMLTTKCSRLSHLSMVHPQHFVLSFSHQLRKSRSHSGSSSPTSKHSSSHFSKISATSHSGSSSGHPSQGHGTHGGGSHGDSVSHGHGSITDKAQKNCRSNSNTLATKTGEYLCFMF